MTTLITWKIWRILDEFWLIPAFRPLSLFYSIVSSSFTFSSVMCNILNEWSPTIFAYCKTYRFWFRWLNNLYYVNSYPERDEQFHITQQICMSSSKWNLLWWLHEIQHGIQLRWMMKYMKDDDDAGLLARLKHSIAFFTKNPSIYVSTHTHSFIHTVYQRLSPPCVKG
jgi:hypothetical protein